MSILQHHVNIIPSCQFDNITVMINHTLLQDITLIHILNTWRQTFTKPIHSKQRFTKLIHCKQTFTKPTHSKQRFTKPIHSKQNIHQTHTQQTKIYQIINIILQASKHHTPKGNLTIKNTRFVLVNYWLHRSSDLVSSTITGYINSVQIDLLKTYTTIIYTNLSLNYFIVFLINFRIFWWNVMKLSHYLATVTERKSNIDFIIKCFPFFYCHPTPCCQISSPKGSRVKSNCFFTRQTIVSNFMRLSLKRVASAFSRFIQTV